MLPNLPCHGLPGLICLSMVIAHLCTMLRKGPGNATWWEDWNYLNVLAWSVLLMLEWGIILKEKKSVYFWEQRCMCWQFWFLPRDAGIFFLGVVLMFPTVFPLHTMFSPPRLSPPTPLPICLPFHCAHPTPGFFRSLSSLVGYWYFSPVAKSLLS